jgi:hypothetical protein
MKRILIACLTLFSVVVGIDFSVDAAAQTQLKTTQIGFHTTLDPSTFASAAIAFRLGDSVTVFRGTGLRNSAQQADTTQAFDLRAYIMPGTPQGAAGDTVTYLRLSLWPIGTVPAVAADSIVVATQVSDDGVGWSATTYSGPLASTGTTPTSRIVLETGGSSNDFEWVEKQNILQTTGGLFNPSSAATVNVKSMYGFKYIRWIITGDHTGQYDLEATGFVYGGNRLVTP